MPHIDLLDLAPFANIPMGDVVSLIDVMAPCQWQQGETLVERGHVPEALLVVTAGALVEHTDGGSKGSDTRHGAPIVLPLMAFFARDKLASSIAAGTLVSGFRLPRATFEAMLTTGHPALSRFLANLLALGEGLHGCKRLG